MPRPTRKDHAAELKRLIDKGPEFGLLLIGSSYSLTQAQQQEINELYAASTRNWLRWLHVPVTALIPEAKSFWP